MMTPEFDFDVPAPWKAHIPLPWTDDDVLTREQVAARLQVTTRTIDRLDLPHVSIGKRAKRYIWGQVIVEMRARAKSA